MGGGTGGGTGDDGVDGMSDGGVDGEVDGMSDGGVDGMSGGTVDGGVDGLSRERAGEPPKPRNAAPPDKRAAELEIGWGESAREPGRLGEDDERLLRERPPHWE